MPVDDPTTHLELTMVHEALILENSGRNLALTELAVAPRTCVFLGLAVQTFLRIWPGYAESGLSAYVPGCPPHPWSIIHGILLAMGRTGEQQPDAVPDRPEGAPATG